MDADADVWGDEMSLDQALQIMEQAVMLALKGCATTQDAKAVLIAWDEVKAKLKEQRDGDKSDNTAR